MPELRVVSVSAESTDAPWGGIGRAVDLMARAIDVCGGVLLETVASTQLGPTEIPFQVVGGGTGANTVYSSEDRSALRLGNLSEVVSEIMSRVDGSPDLVMVQNEELWAVGAAIADEFSVPMVQCLHGGVAVEHGDRWDTKRAEADAVNRADHIIAFSSSRARDLTAKLGRTCEYMPLPLSLLTSDAICTSERRELAKPLRLIAAGRAVEQKGFGVLVHLAAELGANAHLEVVLGHGTPGYEADLRSTLDRLPGTTVRDWLSRDELFARLAAADILIVPSHFEPLGIIAAEGFAHQCVVVGTDVDGLGELLRGGAGIAVPRQTDDLAMATLMAGRILELSADRDLLDTTHARQRARLGEFTCGRFSTTLRGLLER